MRFPLVIVLLVAPLAGCPLISPSMSGPVETVSSCHPDFDPATVQSGAFPVAVGDAASGTFKPWTEGSAGHYAYGGQGLRMLSFRAHLAGRASQCVEVQVELYEVVPDGDGGFAPDAGVPLMDPIKRRIDLQTGADGVTPDINIPFELAWPRHQLRVHAIGSSASGAGEFSVVVQP